MNIAFHHQQFYLLLTWQSARFESFEVPFFILLSLKLEGFVYLLIIAIQILHLVDFELTNQSVSICCSEQYSPFSLVGI